MAAEEEEDISNTDDELPSEPFADNDDDIPSEPFSEATAPLDDEEEAVRDLYASKERPKHIVRKKRVAEARRRVLATRLGYREAQTDEGRRKFLEAQEEMNVTALGCSLLYK
jgi:hypothetical protein